MSRDRLFAAVLACVLSFVCLLVSGCGPDGKETGGGQDGESWLTETSLEDPDAWFSVSVLPVE